MEHIEPQVRNILKCNFVDKLIISNHNPDVHIDDRIKIKDKRLVFINQNVKRGCGYRWLIADELDPEYLIVVDDDILLFPSQLAKLFKHLVNEPEIPHGISGFLHLENSELEFHEKENRTVDFLCETYAVTRNHLNRYMELKKLVAKNDALNQMIDSAADFMIISQTGSRNPKIHHVGRLFKASTFKQAGVAVHKEENFGESLGEVGRALDDVRIQGVLYDPE
ncbi:MAG: hypothetical protein BroJett011_41520 [Chloroflexota bacterium]|nr:MAG: hypothetical protein BroJett011_41520 [Chloroflexota bacterium]